LDEEQKKKKKTRTMTMMKYGQQQQAQLHEISNTGNSKENTIAINCFAAIAGNGTQSKGAPLSIDCD
jgi:mannitol-specific phosphotransferase system IIBC component